MSTRKLATDILPERGPSGSNDGARHHPPPFPLLFVSAYSPYAVGGVGQFMIDLGGRLVARGVRVGMCFRAEPREIDLPPRVSSAFRIEVPVGEPTGLRTPMLLLSTARRLLAARSQIGVVHLLVPQPMTAVAALVARVLGRPVAATVFAPYPRRGRMLADALHVVSETLILRLAKVVVYECRATQNEFGAKGGLVILNGIDTDYYRPDPPRRKEMRARHGIDDETIVVLYVGRITESKGVHDLLRAFSSLPKDLPPSRLLVVGPTETDPERWRHEMAKLGPRVLNIGPIGKDEVRDYYLLADLFVLPSYREGISSSLVEAMACGLPGIVSNVGGNPEVVIDGQSGCVFDPGVVEALRACLTRLIGNPHLREALARGARARIKARFDIETMTEEYYALYSRLLRSGG